MRLTETGEVLAPTFRGAELAVLQATPLGLPVYEGLGFQTLCSFESWTIRAADPWRGVTP